MRRANNYEEVKSSPRHQTSQDEFQPNNDGSLYEATRSGKETPRGFTMTFIT